ncbi:MAG: TM2 domain-containing protein [Maricaulaceae bacterium]
MQGKILDFNLERQRGIISGEDGSRYDFMGSEFNGNGAAPRVGASVDFQPHDGVATAIFSTVPAGGTVGGDKNKVVAALLALFLGGLGIHKFYMGKSTAGVIMLLCGTFGWLLILPALINGLIAFIEFIIYLTKTDEQFHNEYVVGPKAWF